jgi:hypothetical protein
MNYCDIAVLKIRSVLLQYGLYAIPVAHYDNLTHRNMLFQ